MGDVCDRIRKISLILLQQIRLVTETQDHLANLTLQDSKLTFLLFLNI